MAQFLLTEFLGLQTLVSIISVISLPILQILVPILLQISWILQNTPNTLNFDDFEGSWSQKTTKNEKSEIILSVFVVEKYQNESPPIFYNGKRPKTNKKYLKIPDFQALTL